MGGYLVLDTETTGLPDWTRPADADGQPRLASWAMIFADENLDVLFDWHELVKPDGWEMPPEAGAINGLTTERLIAEGKSVRLPIMLLIAAVNLGYRPVAHNLSFDTKIMRGEMRRAGYGEYARLAEARDGICTMRGLTEACAIPHAVRAGYKFPRLSEACQIILGETLEGAHSAVNDAMACLRLLRAMGERHILPLAA